MNPVVLTNNFKKMEKKEDIEIVHADWWDGYDKPKTVDWGCGVVCIIALIIGFMMLCNICG